MDKKAFKRAERELARVHRDFNDELYVLSKNFDVLIEPLRVKVKTFGYLICVHVTAEELLVSVFSSPGCSLTFNRMGIIELPECDFSADVLAAVEAWIEKYRDGE